MREGFSIVMKGSEIKAHVETHVALFEEQARKAEISIAEAREAAHKDVDKRFDEDAPRGPFGQPVTQIDQIVAHRKHLLDLARNHRDLAAHIESDEDFRLSREDIMFLGLLGRAPHTVFGGGIG